MQKERKCKFRCLETLLFPSFSFLDSAEHIYSDRTGDEIVRPRVPLEACLANFSAPEEIHDFYSTALKAKTTALK